MSFLNNKDFSPRYAIKILDIWSIKLSEISFRNILIKVRGSIFAIIYLEHNKCQLFKRLIEKIHSFFNISKLILNILY